MTDNAPAHNERALSALLRYIAGERDRQREAILAAAHDEAASILREGVRNARSRVRETIAEQRRERESRLRTARAAEDSRLRQRGHQLVRTMLDQAGPLLERELHRRWQDAEGRQAWIAMTLDSAGRHLPDGSWTVEHPGMSLPSAGEPPLLDLASRRPEVQLEWTAREDLAAGLRIRSGVAILDTTARALLRDRARAEGLLLGWLATHAAAGVRTLITGSGR